MKPGPGRPKGSPDFRPKIAKMIEKAQVYERIGELIDELEVINSQKDDIRKQLTKGLAIDPDKFGEYLQLLIKAMKEYHALLILVGRWGIDISPKQTEQLNSMVVTLMIDGLKRKEIPIQAESVRAITEGEGEDTTE